MKRLPWLICVFCVVCVVCGSLLPFARAAAQGSAIIRGEVTQVDGVTRASGIVVVAVDTAGAEAARALSGTTGNYSLNVPAPARYVVKALRIGFRPTIMAPVEVNAGAVMVLPIVLSGQAVNLEAVRVEGATTCRIAAEAGRLVGNIWDQARTALAASTMAAGGRPFIASLATYRQYIPRGQRHVQAETVTVVRQQTTSGFVSVPAETLAVLGYFTRRGTQYAYHSPDAAVLLSPEFAAAHCFRVVPGGELHPDWIGIGFRPAALRSGIADVDGTLWLDRSSSELRRLQFTYVNLPRSTGTEPADGSVDFMRLLSGDWIIRRWTIRTPVTEEIAGGGRATQYATVARRVVGGVTREVEADGIPLYSDSSAVLALRLRAGDEVSRRDEAHVVLFGTQNEGYADSRGIVNISRVNVGRFRALVWTNFMTWVGAKPLEQEVEVPADSAGSADVAIPTADEVAAAHCEVATRGDRRLLYGVVKRATGEPVPRAGVWIQRPKQGSMASTVADEFGQWKVCSYLTGDVVATALTGASVIAKRAVSIPDRARAVRVDIVVP